LKLILKRPAICVVSCVCGFFRSVHWIMRSADTEPEISEAEKLTVECSADLPVNEIAAPALKIPTAQIGRMSSRPLGMHLAASINGSDVRVAPRIPRIEQFRRTNYSKMGLQLESRRPRSRLVNLREI